jgi:acetylornithine deacetylase/succinyl-diaminopimelate desuccinylase-like protein
MRSRSSSNQTSLDRGWRGELAEFIAIPSVSADHSHRDDVLRAARWLEDLIKRAGGEAEVTPVGDGQLLLGAITADDEPAKAATVLVYGHFDVQPPEPLERWDSPPFRLEERDGWLYGRGIADDKGQLYALIKGAQALKAARALPVNLRIVCDGEEEIGGHTVVDFLAGDEERIDACVIFDGGRKRPEQPELSLGCRGVIGLHLAMRTGERDLHSGMYGGVALNAAHALMQTLVSALAMGGLLTDELREGSIPLTDAEMRATEALPSGSAMLERVGAVPLDPSAPSAFYPRTWAEPSLDVNGIHSGNPRFLNTTLPVEAHARLTIRVAPGQDALEIAAKTEELLRRAVPAGARMTIERENVTSPGLIPSTSKALRLAADAFEHALGTRPLFVRLGGTLPILIALAEREVPTVISGFSLPESAAHAPNERMRRADIEQAVSAAAELFTTWSKLR